MPDKKTLARYAANRQEELNAAALYIAMAEAETHEPRAEIYRKLAATEEEHAAFWEQRLRESGADVSPGKPGMRARILSKLTRRFGPRLVLETMARTEAAGQFGYDDQPEADGTSMPADERSHARVLASLASPTAGPGMEGSSLARLEGRHRSIGGNALRAAVLGANDGLLPNFSLVMGVAGASLPGKTILITGIAGLLAGAGSMALGEWLSVKSSRELYENEIATEAEELALTPEAEEEELALIYQAKGLSEPEATRLAASLMADPATALDTLTREELGIDPAEMGGSPWTAAATSFLLFAIGAIIPVAPYVFGSGTAAALFSLALSAAGLFGIGAAITLMTGKSVLFSGARSLAFGMVAAALTYGVGRAIGHSING